MNLLNLSAPSNMVGVTLQQRYYSSFASYYQERSWPNCLRRWHFRTVSLCIRSAWAIISPQLTGWWHFNDTIKPVIWHDQENSRTWDTWLDRLFRVALQIPWLDSRRLCVVLLREDHKNTILNLHGNVLFTDSTGEITIGAANISSTCMRNPPLAEAVSTARWDHFYCFPLSAVYHRRSDRGHSWSHIKWKLLIMRSIWWADAKQIYLPNLLKAFGDMHPFHRFPCWDDEMS